MDKFLLNVIHRPPRCLRKCHRLHRPEGLLLAVSATGYGVSLLARLRLKIRHLQRWSQPPDASAQLTFSADRASVIRLVASSTSERRLAALTFQPRAN